MVEVVYIGLVVEEADMTKAVKVVKYQNYRHMHRIRRTIANGFGFLSCCRLYSVVFSLRKKNVL